MSLQAWFATLDAPDAGSAPGFFEDFDTDARALAPAPAPAPAPSYGEAELALACEEACARGFRAGIEAAASEQRERTDRSLAAIARALDEAAPAARAAAEEAARELARTLLAAWRAMFPALCARHGAAEVAAVARVVLPHLDAEPGVVVRIGADAADAVRAELERLEPGHAARVRCVVLETMPPGDLRVEWRQGGAVRDGAAILAEIVAALDAGGIPLPGEHHP